MRSQITLNESREEVFRERLLAWYDVHARDLPWRKNRDPYQVWVSEIMLQQTRVAAVLEHYREFLCRFPTVQKLAVARESSVLAAWSGLGYYRRARMLHSAAKIVSRKLHGEFPKKAEGWRKLPGVGRYTAAAVASIAFGEPIAVVDGNVERVLQRTRGESITGERLWQDANRLLHRKRPGDFNQAMMELGATVCTPRTPACSSCPVIDFCATRGAIAETHPAAVQKKREIHYALYDREGRVLLVQRSRDAPLMASMWELPAIKAREQRSGPERRLSAPENGSNPRLVVTLRHSITVTDYRVHVWRMPSPPPVRGKWIGSPQLGRTALTGLARKILRRAGLIER